MLVGAPCCHVGPHQQWNLKFLDQLGACDRSGSHIYIGGTLHGGCCAATQDEHGVPKMDEHGVSRMDEHGVSKMDEHGVPKIDEHGVKMDEHLVPRMYEHGATRTNEHGVLRIYEHGAKRMDEHGVPRMSTEYLFKMSNSKTTPASNMLMELLSSSSVSSLSSSLSYRELSSGSPLL